jgi:hypothetical protein
MRRWIWQLLPVMFVSVALWSQNPGSPKKDSALSGAVTTPPMGWSSWNSFSNMIDSDIVMAQAKAMVSSGMKNLGYRYINIDEGWWLGQRDAAGNIIVDAKQWPALSKNERAGDMANIATYIHGLGLKAGIYTDAGRNGCGYYAPDLGPPAANTGSEGHYEQDFLQFAKWGFDYVKVDWCGGSTENLDPAVQYAEIARAIRKAELATGHKLFYSICEWGKNSPWTWAAGIGGAPADIWRTSNDIVQPIVANSRNGNGKASFTAMLGNFYEGIHPEAQHTGFYNDPDMMVLGEHGLTDVQNRVHMTLWSISGAPLLVGADLTTLNPESLATLTDPEVVAIDQDALGLQAIKISGGNSGLEVWSKRLAQTDRNHTRRAVALLNRTKSGAPITVRWSQLGIIGQPEKVRDLWHHENLDAHSPSYTATVGAEDAIMLLVEGQEAEPVRYSAVPLANGIEMGWNFRDVKTQASIAWIQIAYTNTNDVPQLAELRVNGETATMVSFPPTGRKKIRTVTVEANLKSGEENSLNFSVENPRTLVLDSIYVLSVSP